MVKKAVCLISGGIDSCVSAFIAKKQGYTVYALTINYGQRHKKEILCAKKIASAVNAIKHIILDVDLSKFGGSSLVDKNKTPEKDRNLIDIGKNIPRCAWFTRSGTNYIRTRWCGRTRRAPIPGDP